MRIWSPTRTSEFDYRLRESGRKLLLDANIVIKWECRQSIAELFRQYLRYGRGKADVVLLHPDSMKPRHLAAAAWRRGSGWRR